jgi:hypothetical protein
MRRAPCENGRIGLCIAAVVAQAAGGKTMPQMPLKPPD